MRLSLRRAWPAASLGVHGRRAAASEALRARHPHSSSTTGCTNRGCAARLASCAARLQGTACTPVCALEPHLERLEDLSCRVRDAQVRRLLPCPVVQRLLAAHPPCSGRTLAHTPTPKRSALTLTLALALTLRAPPCSGARPAVPPVPVQRAQPALRSIYARRGHPRCRSHNPPTHPAHGTQLPAAAHLARPQLA